MERAHRGQRGLRSWTEQDLIDRKQKAGSGSKAPGAVGAMMYAGVSSWPIFL